MFESVIGRAPATPVAPLEEQRPPPLSVGLALGGGAARGWAHIGVLERLAEAGIAVDVIAGCSIGTVIGGCYAAGKLDRLTEFALSLTKRRVFGLMDFSLGGSGLIGGNRLNGMLEKELGDIRIEDLPLGFMCVATEFRTGHEIWLSRGHLVRAMRGIVVPDQMLDEDAGALSEAPTIAKPARRRAVAPDGPAPGLYSIMIDAFNIVQDRITRSRLAGDPPDVTITPRLAPIGLFEFHRAAEAIALGREATERALPHVLDAMAALS
jgi:NTE family protein